MLGRQPDQLLRVDVVRTGDSAVIWLDGELDCATAPQLESALTELTADPASVPDRIIVDADRLSFIDVSGLRPLLVARQRIPAGVLQLRNVQLPVARVVLLLELGEHLGLDGA